MNDIKEKILATFEKAESFTPAWERVTFFSWNDMLYLKDALARAEAAETKVEEMREPLAELYALVRGECPGLLDEDSGGDAHLEMRVEDALLKEKR